MGVSNVYNQAKANAIAAIKQNLSSQGAKKTANAKPEYMKMTGSIFDAPGAKDAKGTTNLADLNTRASLNELNKKPVEATQSKGSNSKNPDSFADIDNASDGRAAANSVSAQGDKVEAYTSQTKREAGIVNRFSTTSQKLDTKIEDANKKFNTSSAKLEARIKSDNQKLEKIVKENEETQKEVDDAQNELDTLLARNSFSMGSSNGTSGTSNDQARITELQTLIGSKVGVMQANGKVIYSLQRSQSRTLTQMQRTNTAYVKTHKANTKALHNQQNETSGIIKTATTIEQYSMLAQVSGQTLALAGKGLIALGSAMSGTGVGSAIGSALIAAGKVMEQVGTVVELVGQYGSAAANITKTAAYAAEGNIMGAMQSAAMAVQSGAAAAKSTAGLKDTFGQINAEAQNATNNLQAKVETNKTMDSLNLKGLSDSDKQKALGGMTEKEYRQALKNEYKTQLTNNGQINSEAAQTEIRNNFQNAVKESGGSVENGVVSGLDKKGRKTVGKQAKTGFRNTASKTAKKSSTNWADNMNKFSQTMGSFAQMYMMFNGGGSMMGMGGNMMGMGYSNGMGYMNNGMGYNNGMNMTDKQRRAVWRQRNAKALGRTAKS